MVTDPVVSAEAGRVVPALLYGRRRQLARDLARSVVQEVADKELPLFERRARDHLHRRLWRRKPVAMDPFGLGTDAVTPAALSAAAAVVGAMSAELVTRLSARAVDRVFGGRRRSRTRTLESGPPADPPAVAPQPTAPQPTAPHPISATELQRYRDAALAGARGHVPEELAQRIADSALAHVVGLLAAGESTARPATVPAPPAAAPPPGTGAEGSPAAGE